MEISKMGKVWSFYRMGLRGASVGARRPPRERLSDAAAALVTPLQNDAARKEPREKEERDGERTK